MPTAHLRVLIAAAVAACVLLTWWLLSARPRTSEPQAVRLTAHADHPVAGGGADRVIIDVEGKVRRPGIVTLPRGSRVHQAIAKAGGLAHGADTSSINLARVLADGEQVVVGAPANAAPVAGGSTTSTAGGGAGALAGRVSLNSATPEQLDTLPGIGPVTAQAIIDFRTTHGSFQRVEDLLDVKGIGEKTLADLKDQVSP